MAIAHSCHVCGCSLTRAWAPLDPVYKLPVVVCPGCGEACVRRPPSASPWRMAGRTRQAIALLLARGLGWLVLIGVTVGTAALMADSQHSSSALEIIGEMAAPPADTGSPAWIEEFGRPALVMCALWFVLLGALVTVGLGHLGRWQAWMAFLGAMAAFVALWIAMDAVDGPLHGALSPMESLGNSWREARSAVSLVGTGVLLTPLGILPARYLKRSMRAAESRRWVKRLARARKARRAA